MVVYSSKNLFKFNQTRAKIAHLIKSITRTITVSSNVGEKDGTKENSALPEQKTHENKTPTEKNDNSIEEKSDGKQLKKYVSQEIKIEKGFSGFADSNVELFTEDPFSRIKRVCKFGYYVMVEHIKTQLGFEFESKIDNCYYGTTHSDILIIGGGTLGSACAYWIKEKVKDGLKVVVLERDLNYRSISLSVSVEGLRQQFSVPEYVQMSLFGAEFMRDAGRLLKVDGLPEPNVCFEPYGCLLLASEEGAETLTENSKMQNSLGAKNVLLNKRRLKERFPWLNMDGIALGCLGLEKEGWFDSWPLMLGFRNKAISLGADYSIGEVVGFQFVKPQGSYYLDDEFRQIGAAIVKRADGLLHKVHFSKCIIAAGADSGLIGKLLGLGVINVGMLLVPLPIERRERYMYCFRSPDGPELNMPLTIDSNGANFRRNGLCNMYITGVSLSPDEEPETDDFEVKQKYFSNRVWPALAKRVPAFENVELVRSWMGSYEHNKIDMHGIIGPHPFFENILFACGFNEYGTQFAPAVGRAIAEKIINGDYSTLDLSRMEFKRFLTQQLLIAENVT